MKCIYCMRHENLVRQIDIKDIYKNADVYNCIVDNDQYIIINDGYAVYRCLIYKN